MAFTRFFDDPVRIEKQLQQATGHARYMMDVPGHGARPSYVEDPYIRSQTFAGNLMTNTTTLESELWGLTKPLSTDVVGKDEYTKNSPFFNKSNSSPLIMKFPSTALLTTEQSRTTVPAWTFRETTLSRGTPLHFNPQENICFSFENNLSTRILEKNNYKAIVPPIPNRPVSIPIGTIHTDLIDNHRLFPQTR